MQIKKFNATKVHGYLNIAVDFFEDLTFLIGINGSGKTTVVRTIHALLAPSLPTLGFTDYEQVTLEITHNGEAVVISSRQDDKGLYIETSKTTEPLFVPKFEMPATEPPYKFQELLIDFYRTQTSINIEHPVFLLLRSLPTPMYLGIERRAQIEREPRVRARTYRTSPRRNIFAGSLAESLDDASELASVSFRNIQDSEDKLKDKLRNALLLRNFEFVNVFPRTMQVKFPSATERANISKQRANVKNALRELGLPNDQLDQVDSFFNKMEEIVEKLPKGGRSETPDQAMVTWTFNQWQFEKVDKLVKLVDGFVTDSRSLYAPIEKFLETVNGFFVDSKKRISINRFGMSVLIGDLEGRELTSLSSGEQQLLVLLTHLAFNPLAAEANVLIIDEPELSLHIAWQEKFADALLKANPKIQFVLATHSPAIILERDGNCKELPGT